MRKKIVYTSLVVALSLAQFSCENLKDEYLDDFNTILYLKNSGETPLTLYKTGENTNYTLIIDKAGNKLDATTSVDVSVMEDAALAIYNSEKGTSYKKLPANCYKFDNTQVQFASSDLYKTLATELVTNEIEKLPALSSGGIYILPIELSNSADSINSIKNVIFIHPTVVVPKIYFDKTGYQLNTITDEGAAQIKLSLPLLLPLDNKWTFNCTTQMDQTLLEAYNKENDVNYSLLPADAYTMNEGGKVAFTPESSTGNLDIMVTRAKLDYGNYVLPFRLTDCSHETFQIDEAKNTCLFGISYVPDESKLHKVGLTEGMIGIYPDPTNEGSIAELIDGKADTYYHSNWGTDISLPHYIDFKLAEECTAFRFEYQTRHNNNNGAPQLITLYGSEDGKSFKKITSISEDLPTAAGGKYKSSIIVAQSFKTLRFSVEKTPNGGSFALAEFLLYTN